VREGKRKRERARENERKKREREKERERVPIVQHLYMQIESKYYSQLAQNRSRQKERLTLSSLAVFMAALRSRPASFMACSSARMKLIILSEFFQTCRYESLQGTRTTKESTDVSPVGY